MAPWWLRTSNDERTEEAPRPAPAAEPPKPTPEGPKIAQEPPETAGDPGDRPWWQGGPSKATTSERPEPAEPAPAAAEEPDGGSEAEAKVEPPKRERRTRRRKKKPERSPEPSPTEGEELETRPRQRRERTEDGTAEEAKPRRRRRRSRTEDEPADDAKPTRSPSSAKAPAKPKAESERGREDDSDDRKSSRRATGERQRSGSRRRPSSRVRDDETPRRESPSPKRDPAETTEAVAVERSLLYTLPERSTTPDERKIAVFCDFENIAIGVRESEIKKLDINLILVRLLQKGKIIVKKAYADWERYSEYKRPFHEAAIELIDIPQKYYSGKNSADIKMVVDAMDLCYSKEHLDTFVIVSGDSDFSPLVSKLKENNKYVIGMGVKNSSSSLLIDNCDEFIYYEDVWRMAQQRPRLDNLAPKQAEVFGLMSDAMLALMRESKDVLWGSMIKQTMQRMRPSFNESYYGYSTFSDLLEDAARKRVIGLKKDQRSGNYVVTGFVVRR